MLRGLRHVAPQVPVELLGGAQPLGRGALAVPRRALSRQVRPARDPLDAAPPREVRRLLVDAVPLAPPVAFAHDHAAVHQPRHRLRHRCGADTEPLGQRRRADPVGVDGVQARHHPRRHRRQSGLGHHLREPLLELAPVERPVRRDRVRRVRLAPPRPPLRRLLREVRPVPPRAAVPSDFAAHRRPRPSQRPRDLGAAQPLREPGGDPPPVLEPQPSSRHPGVPSDASSRTVIAPHSRP